MLGLPSKKPYEIPKGTGVRNRNILRQESAFVIPGGLRLPRVRAPSALKLIVDTNQEGECHGCAFVKNDCVRFSRCGSGCRTTGPRQSKGGRTRVIVCVSDKWDEKEIGKDHKVVDYAGRCVKVPDAPSAAKTTRNVPENMSTSRMGPGRQTVRVSSL